MLEFSRDRIGPDEEKVMLKNLKIIGTSVATIPSVNKHFLTCRKFGELVDALNHYYMILAMSKPEAQIKSAWNHLKHVYKQMKEFISAKDHNSIDNNQPPPGWSALEGSMFKSPSTNFVTNLETAREIFLADKLSEFRLLLELFELFSEPLTDSQHEIENFVDQTMDVSSLYDVIDIGRCEKRGLALKMCSYCRL